MPRQRVTRPDQPDEVVALRLIKESVEQRGYPPTRREIAEACMWRSPSDGDALIKRMHAQGLISIAPGIPRGLQITHAGMVALTEPV